MVTARCAICIGASVAVPQQQASAIVEYRQNLSTFRPRRLRWVMMAHCGRRAIHPVDQYGTHDIVSSASLQAMHRIAGENQRSGGKLGQKANVCALRLRCLAAHGEYGWAAC
jgi:hypothetical protein